MARSAAKPSGSVKTVRRRASRNELEAVASHQLGVLEGFVGFRIRRVQNQLSKHFNELIAEHGLLPGTFSALALIAANPGLSQAELSVLIGHDKASLVAIVDFMEKKAGWVERRSSETDRRRYSLYITRAGRTALSRLLKSAGENEKDLHAVLSQTELKELLRLLDKVYMACFTFSK